MRRTLRPPSQSPLLPRQTFIPPIPAPTLTLAGQGSVPRTAPLSALETAGGRSSWGSLDRSPSSCRRGALPATAGNRDIDVAPSGGEHVHRCGEMGGERQRRALMTWWCLLPRVRLGRGEELFDDVSRGRGKVPTPASRRRDLGVSRCLPLWRSHPQGLEGLLLFLLFAQKNQATPPGSRTVVTARLLDSHAPNATGPLAGRWNLPGVSAPLSAPRTWLLLK